MNRDYVIGIDLGGTKISIAISDLEGNIKNNVIIPTNAKSETGEEIANRMVIAILDLIEESKIEKSSVKTIGIGAPGQLDMKNGIILSASNLPFRNFKITSYLKEKLNIDTYLENDANVAAIGEYLLGAGKGKNHLIYITVSTGIGAGAILNGECYAGVNSGGLEIGHTIIDPNGPICGCGTKGCAESLASGTAIGNMAREAVKGERETSLKKYENVSSFEVFEEAKKGDIVSKEILDKSLFYLGITVLNVIHTFNPEMIVLGGGVSQQGHIVFDKIKEVLNKFGLKPLVEVCEIVPSELGKDTGIKGAVAFSIIKAK